MAVESSAPTPPEEGGVGHVKAHSSKHTKNLKQLVPETKVKINQVFIEG